MRFLVQTINGHIVHDFAFVLTMAKPYIDWARHDKMTVRYADASKITEKAAKALGRFIPVGSVDFVTLFVETFHPEARWALRPLNVPEELFPFAGRKIVNVKSIQDLDQFTTSNLYLKSMDRIKDLGNGPILPDTDAAYFLGRQVSEVVEIVSEWRVLVSLGEIRHLANYAGDCTAFPRVDTVREMIRTYDQTAPRVYTLDVGVKPDGETFVIECHRFFSCGLYGYNDYGALPYLLSQAWAEILRQSTENNKKNDLAE